MKTFEFRNYKGKLVGRARGRTMSSARKNLVKRLVARDMRAWEKAGRY